jgi:hypothetical protein
MYEYNVLKGKAEFLRDWVMLFSVIEVTYQKKHSILVKFACFLDEPLFIQKDSRVEYVKQKTDSSWIQFNNEVIEMKRFVESHLDRERLFWHTKDFIYPQIEEQLWKRDELNQFRMFLLPI